MKCVDREQFFAYQHRMLDEKESEAVRVHVETCSVCQSVLKDYSKLDAALDKWKPTEPSPWFDARVRAAVAESEQQSSRAFFGLRWAQWLAAASVMALVAVSLVVYQYRTERGVPQPVSRQEIPRAVTPAPTEVAQSKSQPSAEEELGEESLTVVDDYDLLANFEVLSELPQVEKKVAN